MEMKDLRLLACANLKRILPKPNIQADNGIWRISAGGDYEASLLLLDDFWNDRKVS